MEVSSKVQFVNEKVKKAFEELNQTELYSHIVKALKNIEQNSFCGIQVPKKQIPKEYFKKYGIHNIWKYNLPRAWRLIYSVENNGIMVISIVLEWIKHKEYEMSC